MVEVVATCPECGLQAKVLPLEDQMIDGSEGKCSHRINPLNCPMLRPMLSVGRQELIEGLNSRGTETQLNTTHPQSKDSIAR
jgi:hypothetical protein